MVIYSDPRQACKRLDLSSDSVSQSPVKERLVVVVVNNETATVHTTSKASIGPETRVSKVIEMQDGLQLERCVQGK